MLRTITVSPLIVLLLICLHVVNAQAQAVDRNGMRVQDHLYHMTGATNSSDTVRSYMSFSGTRKLVEIDHDSIAEAYPWISPDGLRLYYTVGQQGDVIYMASRASVDSTFGSGEKVDLGQDSIFSCWLTPDELNIYYFTNKREPRIFYHATRADKKSPFTTSHAITLVGIDSSFNSGPSFSPDLSELFIFQSYTDNVSLQSYDRIVRLVRTDSSTYMYSDTLALPGYLQPSPGQLSGDGLYYFFSCRDTVIPRNEFLCVLKRSSLSAPFDSLGFLGGDVRDLRYDSEQSSVTGDAKIITFVRSATNLWQSDDIYIARRDTNATTSVRFFPVQTPDNTFLLQPPSPNPAQTIASIRYSLPHGVNDCSIIYYSVLGNVIRRQAIHNSNGAERVDLSSFQPGVYFYRMISEKGESNLQRLIVIK